MIDRRMLWAATLEDLGRRCSVDTALDAEYVERRVAAEGEEFFTTTLPQFGKDLERSLEDRAIGWDLFQGFKRRKRPVTKSDWIQSSEGGYEETVVMHLPHGVPQFLQGFMLKVFSDSYDVTSREFMSYEDAVLGLTNERSPFRRTREVYTTPPSAKSWSRWPGPEQGSSLWIWRSQMRSQQSGSSA